MNTALDVVTFGEVMAMFVAEEPGPLELSLIHISEFLPSNAAAPAIALVNSFGALGGFAGSYLVGWLDSTTGSSSASFLLMAISLAIASGIMLLLRPPAQVAADSTPQAA